ncbi:MAG: DUF5711 family protein [Ruminiclostridium sp.]
MKVPEQPQSQEVQPQQQNKTEVKKREKNVNLTSYRKKRQRRKRIIKLTAITVGIAAFLFVWFNADEIFEPLRGIASKIETKTSYSVGFPVTLPGSTEYSFKQFGDSFSLLTDTYLYTYETTGEQIYALKHGYSHPVQVTSSKRIMLFDKSAYSFAVYSKTSLIYEEKLSDKIMYAAVGDNGLYAVVTDSPRYSNVLYIYDDGGNWKYTKKFADENIMQVCFTGSSEHIIVSTISVENGEILTNYYKYSIRDTDGYVWKYTFSGNSLPCGMYADKERVFSVCDNTVISLKCDDGSLLGEYRYNGTLKDFDFSEDLCIIQYNETSTNKNNLLALDTSAQPLSMQTVSSAAVRIQIYGDSVYALDGANLKKYDSGLASEQDRLVLHEDYTDFIKIGSEVFLLGYDTVNYSVF